jgi:alcohol dehydrogenase
MRALVLNDGVNLISDYPSPAQSPLPAGEALIRVRQAGICNTDLELTRGYASFQGVLGHEFVGVVEKCPSDPAWVGQRVVGEINAVCGICAECLAGRPTHCVSRTALGIRGRDGAFAEYFTLPVENLHVVPDAVSDDGAIFVEPLAAALSVTDLIHIRPTDRVVLLGDGKLGLLLAQVLRLTGCGLSVIGHHAEHLGLLSSFGIDTYRTDSATPNPVLTADVVIEATGTPSGFEAARGMVRPRGKLVLKSTYRDAVDVDLSRVVVDELHIIGSRCGPFEPALRLLARHLVEVDPLIDARFPLSEGESALEQAAQRGALKVVLEM